MDVHLRKNTKFTEAARRLLSSRYVIRSKNQKGFQTIADNQSQLTEYFELVGGNLEINETLGVAYLTSDPEDDESCQLKFGRKITLRDVETMALIFIRKQRTEYFGSANVEAESPQLDIEKLKASMALILKKEGDSDKEFHKTFKGVLERFKELQFLMGNEEEALVITPVVDIVLPADEITTLSTAAEKYFSKKTGEEQL